MRRIRKNIKYVSNAIAIAYIITETDVGSLLPDFGNNIDYVATKKDVGKTYLHIEYTNSNSKDGFFIPAISVGAVRKKAEGI